MWIKDGQGKISLAPWLLGSGILYGPADHADAMLKTLQTHPIDTLCGSAKDFDILVRDDPHQKTHLEQLLSVDSIDDASVKRRWHSLTHLHIQDGSFAVHPSPNSLIPALKIEFQIASIISSVTSSTE